jgi:hypothetical protein
MIKKFGRLVGEAMMDIIEPNVRRLREVEKSKNEMIEVSARSNSGSHANSGG